MKKTTSKPPTVTVTTSPTDPMTLYIDASSPATGRLATQLGHLSQYLDNAHRAVTALETVAGRLDNAADRPVKVIEDGIGLQGRFDALLGSLEELGERIRYVTCTLSDAL